MIDGKPTTTLYTDGSNSLFSPVVVNGKLVRLTTLSEIRDRVTA